MFLNLKKSLLVATIALISTQTFANDSSSKVPKQTVESYVKDFSVSEAEALRRLNIMSNSDIITKKLIEKFGEDLIAGVFFEHEGDFKINVRTTKKGQKSRDVISFVNKELPDLNVEVIPNSPRNFRSIENIIKNQADVISKKVPGFQALGYNPSTDKIVINVYEPTIKNTNDFYSKYGLQKVSGMDTEIVFLQKPISPAMLTGGAKLSTVPNGVLGCTSGFSAFSGDGVQRGIITAYHCTVNETRKNYYLTDINGVTHALTLSPPKASANHDMALYIDPTSPAIASKIDDGSGYLTDIAARGSRSSLKPGNSYVCHSGQKTGGSCGLVTATNVTLYARSTLADGVSQVQVCKTSGTYCNPTFISITSPYLKCQPGDSGGPVWEGYTAYGITSSCNVTAQASGAQPVLYASSLDYVYELPAQFAVTAVPGLNQ